MDHNSTRYQWLRAMYLNNKGHEWQAIANTFDEFDAAIDRGMKKFPLDTIMDEINEDNAG